MEHELSKDMIKKKHRQALLGELMSGICHEINNPLTIILGNLSILQKFIKKGSTDPEKLLSFTSEISTGSARIQQIVNTLRAISKADSLESITNENLKEIFELVQIFLKTRLNREKMELSIDFSNDEIFIPCRLGQVVEALLHVLLNSIEAQSSSSEKWIKIHTKTLGEKVQIFIADAAQCIGTDQVIFNDFFSTKESHLGLGLCISKESITQNEGRIFLDSQNELKGICIELPFKEIKK